jgi:1,4-alpha-glucan branching enzyme
MSSKIFLSGIVEQDLDRIVNCEHSDPHSVLGGHPASLKGVGGVVVRAFHPDAAEILLALDDKVFPMQRSAKSGIFWAWLPGRSLPLDYKLVHSFGDGSTWKSDTPYRFLPTLGEQDIHYASEGKHYRLFEKMGAHPIVMDETGGTAFAVWAPNAKRVSVVGDFNNWDGRLNSMRCMGSSGIWEIFIPNVSVGSLYKFEIKTNSGDLRIKTDPFAFAMELRPGTASVVCDMDSYSWNDADWMRDRSSRNYLSLPLNIYELHMGSWFRIADENYRWATYREVAPKLANHLRKYGFTHVELMPIMEHPFDASWGYQVTGYFAPTSRFGSPEDFKFFVDYLHSNGFGIILDWVPAHFPRDDFSLRLFDGTALYEHEDPRKGEHKDWGTLIFNYGRNEVRNFLVSNALFWLEKYHIDGLRVDAVASIIYLDYSRESGEWIPNRYGGNENLEAIEFIKEFNSVVYGMFPGCFTVAEESTAWTGVTTPAYLGGLGFGFKWDMGWMHDTLRYFSKNPVFRSFHHNDLTFSMMYAYSENFVLPLSHDEVVYGKGSILRKMPGDDWQKLANFRLLMCFMYTHPGKKLLMAGAELATWNEWHHDSSLEEHLLEYDFHRNASKCLIDLGQLYLQDSALWEWDHRPQGFSWIDCNDYKNGVISFIRRGPHGYLICVLNFTPVIRNDYKIGVPEPGCFQELMNSDSEYYGGSGVGNKGRFFAGHGNYHGFSNFLSLTLPPLAGLIIRKIS